MTPALAEGTPTARATGHGTFDTGNFTDAAFSGDAADWRTWAARGLIGLGDGTINPLLRFGTPEARFYAGAAQWIHGRDAEAQRTLAGVDLPEARRLSALLAKPRIEVLAQLPWTRGGPQNLLTAIERDPKFRVVNVSLHPDDAANRAYADVHDFYDPASPPDFFVCQMIEWHLVPPNLHELPCPTFGQTSDYDLHIQAVAPWLDRFDRVLVLDGTEWNDVRRLTTAPVCTFPKSFGVPDALPPVPAGRRRFDVFVSGTVRHPYNPDKAALADAVLDLRELEVLFVNGFISADDYFRLLGRARLSYVYVRRPGSTPTRGLEALAMGCRTVVQDGNVMSLFAGEGDGLFTYDGTPQGLAATIRRALAADASATDPARGAAIVRREFALSRVASQYLRFLTVMAAVTPKRRPAVPAARLDQRRMIWRKGWLPGGAEALQQLAAANEQRWQPQIDGGSPAAINLAARERLLEHADIVRGQPRTDEAPASPAFDRAVTLLRDGVARFPNALVLRFNFVRAALHFGNRDLRSEALELAEATLAQPPGHWQVAADDDVWPWDLFPTFFDYRGYLDEVTRSTTERRDSSPRFVALIRAALHYYAGHFVDPDRHFGHAAALHPGFAPYSYADAARLAVSAAAADRQRACRILRDLACGSIIASEAASLLASTAAALGHTQVAREAEARLRRMHDCTASIETAADEPLRGAQYAPPAVADTHPDAHRAWRTLFAEIGQRPAAIGGLAARAGLLYALGRNAWFLRRHRRVVIFGMGPGGIGCLTECLARGIEVAGFIDNHTALHGRTFLGYPVHSVREVLDPARLGANGIVLASMSRAHEMRSQLTALGSALPVLEFYDRCLPVLPVQCARDRYAAWRVRRRFTGALRRVRRVAIFGASASGAACLAMCTGRGIRVVGFFDNAPTRQGTEFEGRPVLAPSVAVEMVARGDIDAVIIASRGAGPAIAAQLARLGVALPVLTFPN